ncbi:hypothetical protein L9F63_025422, partial [Diploptera punctata]
RGRQACSSPTFRHRLRLASLRVVLRQRRGTTSLTTTTDAVSGETSGNYKPHDHGLQRQPLRMPDAVSGET